MRIPKDIARILEALAHEHGRTMHAEIREALAFWALAHTAERPSKTDEPNTQPGPQNGGQEA